MKRILHTILTLAFAVSATVSVKAQDEATFHHYLANPFLVNPAAAGFEGKHQVFAHSRSQWAGFPGAPNTYALTYSGALGKKVGLGAMVMSENFAALNRFRGQLAYAYSYGTKEYKLGMGFSTEFNRTRVTAGAAGNPLITRNDYLIEDAMQGVTYLDAAVGMNLLIKDRIFVGVAVPNLVHTRLGVINDTTRKQITFFRHFLGYGGYRFNIGESTMLEPSLMVRKPLNAPFEADFNLRTTFLNDQFMAGLTYRPGRSGAVALMAGIRQGGFQLNYSYSASIAEFNNYSRDGHEISLGVEIRKQEIDPKTKKKKKKYRN
ncbi:MAG: hypothetical protein RL757_1060 [Bacteroidota bacterium]